MNVSLHIIKGLLSKHNFNRYYSYVKPDDKTSLSSPLKDHYTLLCSMHKQQQGDVALSDYILLAKQKGLAFLQELEETKVGQETLEECLRLESERSFAYSLGLVCMEVFEGRRELSDVHDTYSKFENIEEVKQTEFVTDNLEELLESVDRNTGLNWRLKDLQEHLGALRRGDFGFIFARPETGKTTFLASEVSLFAEQADSPIVWFNNEERGEKVKARIVQASIGVTLDKIVAHREKAQEKYLTNTKGNVKLFDKGFIHKREVERIVKEMNPSLIVFDQIDKIKGFKGDREDLRLGSIYIWAREIAKEYCPIIGVCQAAASAENKRWLEMDDVAKSKTEKAAEADFILGIGKRHDVGMENVRFINIIKNKLTGTHAKIQCNINAEIARYE